MCGIVGVVLKNNSGFFKQSEDSFFQLLYADTLRGEDATGVIAVEKNGNFHIAKEACEATWFISQFVNGDIYKEMYKTGKAYIGHNRKATQGKATDDNNAHPFVVQKEFAIVHNGTLTNHRALAETSVDSEALAIVLCQAFEKEHPKEALEETLGKVNGAYAVAAFDQRTNKVHLFRNKERPLAIVETHSGWFFASEPAMLYWILARNNYPENDLKIRMVPVDTLLTFHLNENRITTLTEEEYVPKKAVVSHLPWTKVGEGTGHSTKYMKGDEDTSSEKTFSKSSWKRFKRNWLGKRVEFWADDYIEEGGPNGPTVMEGATKVYLMGTSDSFEPLNIVQCLVDTKVLNIDIKSLDSYLFNGRIEDLEWDTKAGLLTIKVSEVHRVLGPSRKTSSEIDSGYIQKKLDEQEAANEAEKRNTEQNKPTLH